MIALALGLRVADGASSRALERAVDAVAARLGCVLLGIQTFFTHHPVHVHVVSTFYRVLFQLTMNDEHFLFPGNIFALSVLVVVAAGNFRGDACDVSPARAPSTLTTAASDESDVAYAWGNDGACVDVYAPGVDVVRCVLYKRFSPILRFQHLIASPFN